MHSNSSSFPSTTDIKRWADYKDDDLLPIIPWVYDVKNVSIKSEPCEWTTVKSRKKTK